MIMNLLLAGLAILAMSSSSEQQPNVQMNADNTAVVVVEFQKQWTEPGFYHRMIRSEYTSRNVYQNTVRLLETARASQAPVIQAPLIIDPKKKKGWFAWLTFASFFTKGTTRAEFTDGIVKDSDIIVSGRYAFNGFVGSDLDVQLKKTGAKNLLFCGFTTEHCVEMTMNEAEKRGYNVWLVADCTATKNAKLQKKVEARWEAKGRLLDVAGAQNIFAPPGKISHAKPWTKGHGQ